MGTSHDPLAKLTVAELDAGSRLIRGDILAAISEQTEKRWQSLAVVAYLLARRTDPAADVATFRAMTANELQGALGLDELQADPPAAVTEWLEAAPPPPAALEWLADTAPELAQLALDVAPPEPSPAGEEMSPDAPAGDAGGQDDLDPTGPAPSPS